MRKKWEETEERVKINGMGWLDWMDGVAWCIFESRENDYAKMA
jgi:hypothetical protein